MLKLGKVFGASALLVSLTLPQFGMAQESNPLEDGVAVCGVPVCSIEATIAELTNLDENKRYNYTNKLVSAYAESQNITILENLVDAGKEIKELTKAMKDADWVIREANTLVNNSVLNLAKYSPVNAVKMLELFKQLSTPTMRYNVIAHFQTQAEKIEDLSTLNELVKFAEGAKEYTISIGDESWIPRAASSLASDITIKLTFLDPVHEGVYTVEVVEGDDKVLDFDKVVVLDSTSEDNLVVKFLNSKLDRVVFSYTHASIVGSTVKGQVVSNGSLSSSFELNVNRNTGAIKGTVKTTRTNQIVFKGSQSFSTRSIFAGSVPSVLNANSVIGDMKGEILGIKGTLSVQSFLPNVYSASFVADNGLVVIDFKGKFFAQNGVLTLTHKNKIKLAVALRKSANGIAWRGVSYSTTNGKVVEANFTPAN